MKSQALYIDSNSHRTMHEQYNAAMFAVCASSFDKITYCAGRSSLNNTTKLLASIGSIDFKKKVIFVLGGDNKISLLLRSLISCIQNIRFLVFSNKETVLIYNFNNFFSIYWINFLNKVLKRRIIICCHSEIAFIVNDCVHSNLIYDFRTNILRYIFINPKTKIADNLFFVVLGDSIKFNLSEILSPEKVNHIISIDHPYIFNKIRIKKNHSGVKLGVVGTMAHVKGADILIKLAIELNLKGRNDLSISIIGKILCDSTQFQEVGITLPVNKGKESLPREEFDLAISELDYILYLYPVNSYKYTASGSLMDSINMECPAISFRNDYFQYVFEKFGIFGFLLENEEDMIRLIESLPKSNLSKESYSFKEIKTKLSPSEIKKDFRSKLISIGFIKNDLQ